MPQARPLLRIANKAEEFRMIHAFIQEQKRKGRSDAQLANWKLSRKRALTVGGKQYQLSHSFLLILDQKNHHQLTPLLLTHGKHKNINPTALSAGERVGLLGTGAFGRVLQKRARQQGTTTPPRLVAA
jgi:hypothetical protein